MSHQPVMTDANKKEAKALYDAGMTDRGIADVLWGDSTKYYRIRDWRVREGLQTKVIPTGTLPNRTGNAGGLVNPPREKRVPYNENAHLVHVAMEARAAGMTYGEYVAQAHDEARGFSEAVRIRSCAARRF